MFTLRLSCLLLSTPQLEPNPPLPVQRTWPVPLPNGRVKENDSAADPLKKPTTYVPPASSRLPGYSAGARIGAEVIASEIKAPAVMMVRPAVR